MMRQNKNLMDINIDALYNILKQNQGDVNDAMGAKKKTVMVTSDPLALIAEKTKVSKSKEKVVVSSDSEGSDADDFSELKKITALLVKAFDRRKFYSKPTNNILRTSSTSQSANKKQEFVKSYDKQVVKKADEKKRDLSRTKMLLAKKDKDEQVLSAEDQAWMESNSDPDQEINANMVFMAQIEKVLSDLEASSSSVDEKIFEVSYYLSESESESEFETSEDYDNSTDYGLFVNNDDDQEIFHDAIESASENFIENHIDSQKDYDKSNVDHNDFKEKDHLVDNKDFENQNKDLQDKYAVLKNQATTFEMNNKELNEQLKELIEKNNDLLAQTKLLKEQLQVKHVVIDTHAECFESSENVSLESENQSENDCLVVEKKCDKKENSKVIAPGMFKLNVSQCVSPISMSKSSCDSKNVEIKLKRKRHLDTFSSVRRPKHNSVVWKKKGSSNTSNVDLSAIRETSSAYMCNDAMNVSYDSKMNDLLDDNNFFIFDDESVKISHVSKMPFRKKSRDSMNVHSKSTMNKSLPRTIHKWLPKLQLLAEPVAKWFPRIVQICLWIINSGCSKHMTGNRTLLTNFVEKFLGTVRFGNNDFAVIAGYGDVVIGSMTIKKVYYVEGLGHNLFSVGQFCDKGLEVAFRKSTCFFRNKDGVDLLTGDRSSNLYTIALNKVASNSLTCLLAKASSLQSWLWHQRLSHLNFATINNLVKNNLVQGLPKMKFEKDHLCFACEQGKIHRKHHKSKTAFALNKPLYLLHMDLCGPIRIQSINRKRYVLVVVDDYSRYTWVFFFHSKDEASKVIISFINKTQVNLQLQVQRIRMNNGSKFKNKTLAKFFDEVGITQQFSAARTPQQNGVVKRRNRTLVKAARTMLTFANLPSFLWAKAITTACFKQNRSIIHKHFNKTPYELINKRKPNIKFFLVFGCRCYLLNDYEDIGKLKAKGDIRVFVGYSKESVAFRIYNKRNRKIHESVNVNFDEISEMASKQSSLEPSLSNLNETGKSSNLSVSQVSETSKKDLEDLFQDFYDEYFDSSKIMKSSTTNVETSINEEVFHEVSESFEGESSLSSLNNDVQQSPKEVILPQTNTQSIPINMIPNGDEASTSHNVFNERLEDSYFDASTSFHDPSNVYTYYQPYPHEKKWTKDHPLHKIIGDPKPSVRTRSQLANSCLFSCLLSFIEPNDVAEALKDVDWVSAMQE
nr:hypothetical protein [Tanacetum cinerariifolium]